MFTIMCLEPSIRVTIRYLAERITRLDFILTILGVLEIMDCICTFIETRNFCLEIMGHILYKECHGPGSNYGSQVEAKVSLSLLFKIHAFPWYSKALWGNHWGYYLSALWAWQIFIAEVKNITLSRNPTAATHMQGMVESYNAVSYGYLSSQ